MQSFLELLHVATCLVLLFVYLIIKIRIEYSVARQSEPERAVRYVMCTVVDAFAYAPLHCGNHLSFEFGFLTHHSTDTLCTLQLRMRCEV